MGPISYSLNVASPFQTAVQGYRIGAEIRDDQQAQQDRQLKLDAAQRQQEAAAAMQAELTAVSRNPSPQAIVALTVKYPQLSEHFTRANSMLSEQQRAAEVRGLAPIYAAAVSGRTDMVEQLLNDRATAYENSGMTQDAKEARDMAALVKQAPGQAATFLGVALSSAMGAEKFAETFGKLGTEQRAAALAPAQQREAEAKATTAEVGAKYAEKNALADLEKKGWDIKAIQSDIAYKKEANRIAAINAAAAGASNDLKRQELQLKLEEAVAARDAKVREKVAEFDTRISGINDARTLIGEIKGLRAEAWFNPTGITGGAGMIPATNARTQVGKIEQLKNTLSLEFLDKLKGPTSDRDILFLKNIAANLDNLQSDKSFAAELEKIDAALVRVDAATRKRYGAPPAPAAPQPGEQTATNPQTGERLVLRGGQWVPLK